MLAVFGSRGGTTTTSLQNPLRSGFHIWVYPLRKLTWLYRKSPCSIGDASSLIVGFSMVHVSFRECTPNATPPRMHYYHVRFPGVTWISPVSASIFVSPSGSGRWRGRSQWGGGWGRWHQEGSTGMEGWSQPGIHPLETNMFPENQWLEDVFPTERVPF